MTHAEYQQRKRELRTGIGRMRRRINNRLLATRREGRRLLSWRKYVNLYPTHALLAAFAAGLAVSYRPARNLLMRKIGMKAVSRAAAHAGQDLWEQFRHFWSQQGDGP
jgi:hypothetical protein